MFAIGFVSMFISGGLTGIWLGNSTIDIQLHDTYFVVAHFHIVMGIAAFFGMFAGIYHWFPRMFGRMMNETMAYIHFAITFIGAYLIFWPMHFIGLAGVPRRYYSFNEIEAFSQYGDLNKLISVATIIVFLGQLLFLVNFFWSMYKTLGRQIHWNGLHLSKVFMETGMVNFLQYIDGHTITVEIRIVTLISYLRRFH
jgi:cytochrome c oxidase subunit 1